MRHFSPAPSILLALAGPERCPGESRLEDGPTAPPLTSAKYYGKGQQHVGSPARGAWSSPYPQASTIDTVLQKQTDMQPSCEQSSTYEQVTSQTDAACLSDSLGPLMISRSFLSAQESTFRNDWKPPPLVISFLNFHVVNKGSS